ncbi:universal stress protein [Saccharomonospora piscinae]|uniref:universal stress protein n=1 Tax=Saccharomonospora piscinae TaxID=687388 RepID=UPI0004B7B0B1
MPVSAVAGHSARPAGAFDSCRRPADPATLVWDTGWREQSMGLDAGAAEVVVGVDGSADALRAVAWGAVTAARRHRPLRLVSAIAPPTPYGSGIGLSPGHFVELEERGRAWLAEAGAVAERVTPPSRVPEIGTELAVGTAAPVLTERARAAFVVAVGAAEGQRRRGRLGTVTAALLAHAACPLALVRWPGDSETPPRDGAVVVGVDGSPPSAEAVAVAFEEAAVRAAPLVAVHAADAGPRGKGHRKDQHPWGEDETADAVTLAERLAGLREWYPEVDVERVVARDGPEAALLRHAGTAQLLVVGTTGHGELGGRMSGSTSHALAHSAPCPLLVVPQGTRAGAAGHAARRAERAGP